MEYRFEELQPLLLAVYDVDNESSNLEDSDFLGETELTLGCVVSIGKITRNLQHKTAKGEGEGDLGTITVGGSVFPLVRRASWFNVYCAVHGYRGMMTYGILYNYVHSHYCIHIRYMHR